MQYPTQEVIALKSMDQNSTIQIAESVERVKDMREVWTAMQSHPDGDMGFYLTLLKTRAEILRPHVITLNNDGLTRSMLVGRIEKVSPTVGLGYAKIPLPSVRCLTLIGTGLFGDSSEESVSALMKSIEGSLASREFDVAWFHQLGADSGLHKAVKEAGGFLYRDRFPLFNDHWKVKLPGTYEQFLQQRTSNTRYNVKRYAKRLQASFGERLRVREFKDPQDIDVLMADAETIAAKTYHRGLNAGFADDEETRQRMLLYASEGRLRAHILYLGAKPVAFWCGFIYKRTFYIWTTGYDPEYSDARPGLFLLQKVFQALCQEKIADEVDFGSGDAQYKRDFGDGNRQDVSMYLFGPSLRGICLNVLRTPLLACSEGARWGLARTNLLQKAKKLWRSRLSRSEGSANPINSKVSQ